MTCPAGVIRGPRHRLLKQLVGKYHLNRAIMSTVNCSRLLYSLRLMNGDACIVTQEATCVMRDAAEEITFYLSFKHFADEAVDKCRVSIVCAKT